MQVIRQEQSILYQPRQIRSQHEISWGSVEHLYPLEVTAKGAERLKQKAEWWLQKTDE